MLPPMGDQSTSGACPSCGTVSEGKFCHQCGASLRAVACPGCGARAVPGAKFCAACGGRMTAPADRSFLVRFGGWMLGAGMVIALVALVVRREAAPPAPAAAPVEEPG